MKDSELDQAQTLITALQKALAPLETVGSSRPFDFAELAHRHREVLVALSSDQDGIAVAFEQTQGAALSAAFDDLLAEQKPSGLMVQLGDYPDVFQTAYSDRMPHRAGLTRRRGVMSGSSRCTARYWASFIPSGWFAPHCSGPKPLN